MRPQRNPFPGRSSAGAAGADGTGRLGGRVATALGAVALAGLLALAVVVAGGLNRPSETGWALLLLCALGLWSLWLVWRIALGDPGVPASVLHPFLGVVLVVLLVHRIGPGAGDGASGRFELLDRRDPGVLIRLMVFALLMLLAQDLLPRIRDGRWVLTGLGLLIAVGSALRLAVDDPPRAVPAVTLTGLTGVGILLGPILLPHPDPRRGGDPRLAWLTRGETVLRLAAAGLLSAAMIVSHYQAARAAVFAAAGVAAAMLLGGAFLDRHRRRLWACAAVLGAGAGVAIWRLAPQPPAWAANVTVWGTAQATGLADAGDLPGAAVVALTAGWFGLGVLLAGMLATLIWSLSAARRSAGGDQARSALWACVSAVAAAALLSAGGLAVPAAAMAAAVAWGLVPHMMAHHVGRFRGRGVLAAFLAALVVFGLAQRVSPGRWVHPGIDGPLHAAGSFLLAAVLMWQTRCRRWWHGVICAAVAAALAGAGELLQRHFSLARQAEWSDAGWDVLGAAAALGVFLLLRGLLRLEAARAPRSALAFRKYRSWDEA